MKRLKIKQLSWKDDEIRAKFSKYAKYWRSFYLW